MKNHPSHIAGENELHGRKDLEEYSGDLVSYIQSDLNAMDTWLEKQAHFYDRRYGRLYRNPQFPWPGSSEIVMPTMDIYVDQMKPPMMNLVFGGSKIVNMVPMNAAAVDNTPAATDAMNSLIKYRIPDFMMQTAHGIENWAQHGLKIDKIFYSYKTRIVTETVRRKDLVGNLSTLVVMKGMTDEEVAQVSEEFGVAAMTPEMFKQNYDAIKNEVVKSFGLDPEEKVDVKACKDIMDFLKDSDKETILIKKRQVVEDTPKMVTIPIQDVIVPPGTKDIADATRITHRMYFSESDIRQRARDEVWVKAAVDLIFEEGSYVSTNASSQGLADDALSAVMTDRAQSASYIPSGSQDNIYEIWECYSYWDIDGDGLDEKVVITMEPRSGAVLKAIELPFDHGEWPFTGTPFEPNEPNYFSSRGIPEKLDDLDKEITAQHRAKLNNLLIQTSTSFTYRDSTGLNPNTIQWMPGLMIPVQDHTDLAPIPMPHSSLELEREETILNLWAERHVGGIDQGIAGDARLLEPRTATEIRSRESARQRVLGVRAMIFQRGMQRNYQMLWSLWMQYGPDDFFIHVTGQPPVKMGKYQISGKFDLIPAGAVGDMDPDLRAQRAFERLQAVMQMAQLVDSDPRYELDAAQALADWLNEVDHQGAQRILRRRSQEEIAQIVQQQQMDAAEMGEKRKIATAMMENTPVTPEDAMDVLKFIKSQSPHGLLQLIQQAGASEQLAQRNATLTGMPAAAGPEMMGPQ